jgi:membrane protein implicated in regulation of membrane protease activity
MNSHHSLWMTFRWPLLIAALSLTGLVSALLVEGAWDWVFAALIASCVAPVVWARWQARHRRPPSDL